MRSAAAPNPTTSQAYRQINQHGWTRLAREGCLSSQAFGSLHFAHARGMLDPGRTIPWNDVRNVLCLAAAGGQQAPLFASLGYEVVSADLCPEQLRRDEQVALRHGLAIECIQTDMLNLSALYGSRFDLVYQAVSACYVPDVRKLYQEVAKVLRPGGLYRVEHWNPMHLQLAEDRPWNGHAYQIARAQDVGIPIPWHSGNSKEPTCVHFMHSLGDLLGGLCEAGFYIVDFDSSRRRGDVTARPGSDAHLASFIPPFFTVLSRTFGPEDRPR
jgi:SAM-dependent methyltransferase